MPSSQTEKNTRAKDSMEIHEEGDDQDDHD